MSNNDVNDLFDSNSAIVPANSRIQNVEELMKQMIFIEKEMKTLRDDRKAAIESYISDGRLTKEDVKLVKSAVALAKKIQSLDNFEEIFNQAIKVVEPD